MSIWIKVVLITAVISMPAISCHFSRPIKVIPATIDPYPFTLGLFSISFSILPFIAWTIICPIIGQVMSIWIKVVLITAIISMPAISCHFSRPIKVIPTAINQYPLTIRLFSIRLRITPLIIWSIIMPASRISIAYWI